MTEVEAIVASLWELDDDVLEAQLGSRVQAIGDDVAGRGARGVDPASLESIDVNVAARASIDPRFLDAGRQLLDRVNPLTYELMCKPLGGDDAETRKILDETINQNYTKAAGMLAPVLVSGVGLAPAVATLVATLIIKKVSKYIATGICETWEKNLPKSAIGGDELELGQPGGGGTTTKKSRLKEENQGSRGGELGQPGGGGSHN